MTYNKVTDISKIVRSDSKYATSVRDLIPKFMNLQSNDNQKYFLDAFFNSVDDQIQGMLISAQDASKNLFISTASGQYLLNLGSAKGFSTPVDSGVDSSAFTKIVPAIVSAPKQVLNSMISLMGIFYDKTRISPYLQNTVPEPYNLTNADNLIIQTESGSVGISFLSTQIANISSALASDIVSVINSSQTLVQASVYVSRDTNQNYIQIISNTFGVGAYIQVVGGTAQNVLLFPPVANTQQETGTTWLLSKTQTWTDVVKFQWDGNGQSPELYHINIGDYVTIRGLSDPYTSFNGSFQILNVGSDLINGNNYDYFEISNIQYQSITGSITLPLSSSMVFTVNKKTRILDASEYAVISELNLNSISVFVPAVPMVLRSDLFASSHAHGWQGTVTNFTRTSIIVNTVKMEEQPITPNSIILTSDFMRYDAIPPAYKAVASIGTGAVTYVLSSDPEYSILPYTIPTIISDNGSTNIVATVNSNIITMKFDYPHGLRYGWSFNIQNALGAGNFTSSLINQEHQVYKIIDNNTITFQIKDPNSSKLLNFSGVSFNNFALYRNDSFQNGYDFYLIFDSQNDLDNSDLTIGSVFTMDYNNSTPAAGQSVLLYSLSKLNFQVISIDNLQVNCYVGIGPLPITQLITYPSVGLSSGSVGGSGAQYFMNQTSSNNSKVLKNLTATFAEYTPSSNAAYVGSYIYDPIGVQNAFTVGEPVVQLLQQIEGGSNTTNILVNSVQGFPSNGYILMEYGTNEQEGPIRYLSVVEGSSTVPSQIAIDPAYIFKYAHSNNSQLQIVTSLSPFTPSITGSDYPFYITGTTQARDFFFLLLKSITAAGIFVQEDIQYPATKYQDPAINPYE